jgi:hypothetical protein
MNMTISEKIDTYLKEDSFNRINKIVDELIDIYNIKDKIPYWHVLGLAGENRIYKDDLPDLQFAIEDEGFEIDYKAMKKPKRR